MEDHRPLSPKNYEETADDIDRKLRERRQSRLRQRRALRRRRRRRLVCLTAVFFALALVFTVRKISGTKATDRTPAPAAEVPAESDTQAAAADTTFTESTAGQTETDGAPGSSRAALTMAETAASSSLAQPAQMQDGKVQVGDALFFPGYTVTRPAAPAVPAESDVQSAYAVLIDAGTGSIAAEKNADSRIYPASMTKVLTILTAAELLNDPEASVTITQEITDYAYQNDCSIVGFQVGDTVSVRDLFYGTILPSGADAALALAVQAAGSQEAFVEQMNRKVQELGLTSSHFTNCVGIFDEENYSTCLDMAMILKAALENSFCREVLTTKRYTTSPTPAHPEGIELSNWFLRRIEDKDSGGTVLAGKTGFVNESGNCAVSYAVSASGTPFLCCTANAHSAWRCIYDHVALYKLYRQQAE